MRVLWIALGSAVIGLAVAGCSTLSPSPSASPSPTASGETFASGAPANQCATADLAVTIAGPDGSAGHLNYQVVFTNNGPECVLEGYPAVSVMISAGSGVLGASAVNDATTTVSPVTLRSGGTAVATLSAVNIDPGGGPLGDQCVVDHGDGFAITPPNSFQPIRVQLDSVPACSNGTSWMNVGPVTSG